MIPYDEGGLRLCIFFLPWKRLEKHIWTREDFWLRVLGQLFRSFGAMNWINKVHRMFSRCFESKIGLNRFLGEKIMNFVFPATLHHSWILGVSNDTSSIFLFFLQLGCCLPYWINFNFKQIPPNLIA
jgi:hypothetical protein